MIDDVIEGNDFLFYMFEVYYYFFGEVDFIRINCTNKQNNEGQRNIVQLNSNVTFLSMQFYGVS